MELQGQGDLMGPLQALPVQTRPYDTFLLPDPNKAADTVLRMLFPKFRSEEDSFFFFFKWTFNFIFLFLFFFDILKFFNFILFLNFTVLYWFCQI